MGGIEEMITMKAGVSTETEGQHNQSVKRRSGQNLEEEIQNLHKGTKRLMKKQEPQSRHGEGKMAQKKGETDEEEIPVRKQMREKTELKEKLRKEETEEVTVLESLKSS